MTKLNIYYIILLHKLIKLQSLLQQKVVEENAFPNETRPYIDESVSYDGYPQNAEKVNGRWAMIGFVALLGAYITTGQIIPGIF